MTSIDPRHAASSRPRQVAAAVAALAPVLAVLGGCGGTVASVPLPARPRAATSAVTSAAAASSPRQQVIAALVGYTAALSEADKSQSSAAAHRLLQPYLAATRIAGVVQTMSSIWAKGEVFFGQDVLHVISVTVSGSSAFVHDCDDTSGMGLDDQATGQLVPGSAGSPELNIVTHLALMGGRWLVQFQLVEDVPCTP